LIASALALAPEERLQTAEELARPLREFLRQDDLGDLARRLGERVGELLGRGARARTPASAPLVATGELSAEALAACSAELPTRTFAARPALLEWTAKIESVPPEGASALTVGATPAIESGITRPGDDGREQAYGATRRAPRPPMLAALALGGALLLGLGGRVWLRAPSPEAAPAVLAAPSPAAASAPVSLAAASTAPASVALAPAPETARPAAVATPRTAPAAVAPATAPTPKHASARPAASRADAAAAQRASELALSARLQLTADPPAWVEIDATRVGRTPLSALPVRPGRHAIRFENPLLGERLEAVVDLAPRGSARVHADFSSASPQVYVR
jgi:hypothetical protein